MTVRGAFVFFLKMRCSGEHYGGVDISPTEKAPYGNYGLPG